MYRRYAVRAAMLGAALALGVSSAGLRAAEIGKYVPKDTQWLISVNVRQIFDSAVVKKHGTPQLKKVLENSAEVQGALSQLGYDPLTDLSRVVIALPAVKESRSRASQPSSTASSTSTSSIKLLPATPSRSPTS